jgi:hypothetical protein
MRSSSKRKSPVEKEIIDIAQAVAVSTPQRSDKALRPEGTSPMKISEPAHVDSNLGRQTTDADCWGLYNCLDVYSRYPCTFEYAQKIAPSGRYLEVV